MRTCYLCGKSEQVVKMTNDHVPPRCFFKKPHPKNLIEVDCCQECNWGHSSNDRHIRNLLNMLAGSGEDKDWVFYNKTSKDLQNGGRKLLERIAAEMKLNWVDLGGKYYLARTMDITDEDVAMVNTFMIRVVKGLLRYFYPNYDHTTDEFECNMIRPGCVSEVVQALKVKPIADKRGSDAFYSLRLVTHDLRGGIWYLIFYQGSTFQIVHMKPGTP